MGPAAPAFRSDGSGSSAELTGVGPAKTPLWLSPAQAAAALTEFFFGDEEGEERSLLLRAVESAAREYGIKGTTLAGTASVDNLVTPLLSGFDKNAKVMTSH